MYEKEKERIIREYHGKINISTRYTNGFYPFADVWENKGNLSERALTPKQRDYERRFCLFVALADEKCRKEFGTEDGLCSYDLKSLKVTREGVTKAIERKDVEICDQLISGIEVIKKAHIALRDLSHLFQAQKDICKSLSLPFSTLKIYFDREEMDAIREHLESTCKQAKGAYAVFIESMIRLSET